MPSNSDAAEAEADTTALSADPAHENDVNPAEQPEPNTDANADANNSETSYSWEDILCPICLDPIMDTLVASCSHRFCTFCIKRWFRTRGQSLCPVCRSFVDSVTPNPELDTVIDGLLPTNMNATQRRERAAIRRVRQLDASFQSTQALLAQRPTAAVAPIRRFGQRSRSRPATPDSSRSSWRFGRGSGPESPDLRLSSVRGRGRGHESASAILSRFSPIRPGTFTADPDSAPTIHWNMATRRWEDAPHPQPPTATVPAAEPTSSTPPRPDSPDPASRIEDIERAAEQFDSWVHRAQEANERRLAAEREFNESIEHINGVYRQLSTLGVLTSRDEVDEIRPPSAAQVIDFRRASPRPVGIVRPESGAQLHDPVQMMYQELDDVFGEAMLNAEERAQLDQESARSDSTDGVLNFLNGEFPEASVQTDYAGMSYETGWPTVSNSNWNNGYGYPYHTHTHVYANYETTWSPGGYHRVGGPSPNHFYNHYRPEYLDEDAPSISDSEYQFGHGPNLDSPPQRSATHALAAARASADRDLDRSAPSRHPYRADLNPELGSHPSRLGDFLRSRAEATERALRESEPGPLNLTEQARATHGVAGRQRRRAFAVPNDYFPPSSDLNSNSRNGNSSGQPSEGNSQQSVHRSHSTLDFNTEGLAHRMHSRLPFRTPSPSVPDYEQSHSDSQLLASWGPHSPHHHHHLPNAHESRVSSQAQESQDTGSDHEEEGSELQRQLHQFFHDYSEGVDGNDSSEDTLRAQEQSLARLFLGEEDWYETDTTDGQSTLQDPDEDREQDIFDEFFFGEASRPSTAAAAAAAAENDGSQGRRRFGTYHFQHGSNPHHVRGHFTIASPHQDHGQHDSLNE